MNLAPALVVLAMLAAVHYSVRLVDAPPSARRSLVKTVPLACAAAFALAKGTPGLLVLALGFSAVGDLALSRPGERAFLAGLSAFLLAHLAYIALFWTHLDISDAPLMNGKGGLLWFIWPVLTVLIVRNLWPHLGAMKAPVVAYAGAITGMLMTGWLLPKSLSAAPAGAFLFVFSDAVLAQQVFKPHPPRWSSQMVWWTYIIGQVLILAAFV